MKRRPVRAGIYFFYLFALVAAAFFAHYRVWVSRLARRQVPPDAHADFTDDPPEGFTAELFNSVGSVSSPKRSAFFHYPESKPAGRLRLGAFGDSFTYGQEADESGDYPSHLQSLFRTNGYPHVEVLNFGNGGHGFHQAFRIWEELAGKYGIDIVLLGPGSFQIDRDCTFSHVMWSAWPYYLHGRYVLEDGELRFLDVLGGTGYRRRFDAYFGFLPAGRYLRYDYLPPAFLRHLNVGGRWNFRNPFYHYKGPVSDEIFDTHRHMLKRLGESARLVVLLHHDEQWIRAAREAGPNVIAWPIPRLPRFPSWRTAHPGAEGYRLIARMYFDVLTGRPRSRLTVLEPGPAERVNGVPRPPPAEFRVKKAALLWNGETLATLTTPTMDCSIQGTPAEGVAAFLVLRTSGVPFVESPVALLPDELREGDVVELANGGRVLDRRTVRRLIEDVNLFEVSLPAVRFDRPNRRFAIDEDALRGRRLDPRRRTALAVGGRRLLNWPGSRGKISSAELPLREPAFALFLTECGFLFDEHPSRGDVFLRLQGAGRGALEFPLETLRRRSFQVAYPGLEAVRGLVGREGARASSGDRR